MFIEQIIEFESRGPGPAGCTCNPKTRGAVTRGYGGYTPPQ